MRQVYLEGGPMDRQFASVESRRLEVLEPFDPRTLTMESFLDRPAEQVSVRRGWYQQKAESGAGANVFVWHGWED